jgi:hypothetical protein
MGRASPAGSAFGDVKRLSVPVSPSRSRSLPASPGLPKSPAKPVSPFYSTRMKDTAETSATTALFRKGAEQIVLDHDKQVKLANLIKAVTQQKLELTEEREQAIAGFKAERAKLRAMQQKTLSLYAKMKAHEIKPVSVGVRDVADSSDDDEGQSVAPGSYDMARTAGSIFASLRGVETKSVFQRWRSFAKQRAAAEAHVFRMTRRWTLGSMARVTRAWWRLAVTDSGGTVAAAEAAALRLKKRVGRRAFAAWRGVAAGLSEEELAKLSSASANFVAGSPAAGLMAIAQLARDRGGSDAGTRRRIVAEAVAASLRSAGEFDVEDILRGAEGSEAFFEPTRYTVCLDDEVNTSAAARAAGIMFGKTTRGRSRNALMHWSAWAARARAARLRDEINTLRFEQSEHGAAAMVAAEEKDALVQVLAESEKKASKSSLSSNSASPRGVSAKSAHVKSGNQETVLPSSSDSALPPAPDSPTSTSDPMDTSSDSPEQLPADVTAVSLVESKDLPGAAETWSEDAPVTPKATDGKKQPACCVIM